MMERTEQEIMQNWKGDINTPLVSICTITYNHGSYIAEALDSFLMQETNFPFEIIIDDDCSLDNTADIIKQYKGKFPNIINICFREKNIGMMRNISENIQRSKGKYIAICEGDDYWTDTKKLQIQIDLMLKNPECHLSFHSANEVINGKLTGKVWGNHDSENKIFTASEVISGTGFAFCPTASLIIKRQALDPLPEYFINAPVGDYFLQILGSLHGGALYIGQTMSIYRRGNTYSWTASLMKGEKTSPEKYIRNREDFIFRYIQSSNHMADEINPQYRYLINQKISGLYCSLAGVYLKHNMWKKFRDTIEKSHQTYPLKSKWDLTYYRLRFFPKWAKNIYMFRAFLQKHYMGFMSSFKEQK